MQLNWIVYHRTEDQPAEVMPDNDIGSHSFGLDCRCKPFVRDSIVVHNSFDGREYNLREELMGKASKMPCN